MGYRPSVRLRWLEIGFLRVHEQRRSDLFLFWSIITMLAIGLRRFENQENYSELQKGNGQSQPNR